MDFRPATQRSSRAPGSGDGAVAGVADCLDGRRRTVKPQPFASNRSPPSTSPRSTDPDDDYLLALAVARHAFLVTGDQDLLGPRDDLPILTSAEFVTKLREQP
jgi:hypothetical protein